MHKNPRIYSMFRLIMHKNPGVCCIFGSLCTTSLELTAFLGTPCTKILDFASIFRFNMHQKGPVLVFCMLNMDSLEVAASVGSDAQDLVHDSRGPLSPPLSLASVYIFRMKRGVRGKSLRLSAFARVCSSNSACACVCQRLSAFASPPAPLSRPPLCAFDCSFIFLCWRQLLCVRLPETLWTLPRLPRTSPNFPFPGDFPETSLTVDFLPPMSEAHPHPPKTH